VTGAHAAVVADNAFDKGGRHALDYAHLPREGALGVPAAERH
jgi:hypothetical protein